MTDMICGRTIISPGKDKIKFRSTTNTDDDNSFSSPFIKQYAVSTDERPIAVSVWAQKHTRSKKQKVLKINLQKHMSIIPSN